MEALNYSYSSSERLCKNTGIRVLLSCCVVSCKNVHKSEQLVLGMGAASSLYFAVAYHITCCCVVCSGCVYATCCYLCCV